MTNDLYFLRLLPDALTGEPGVIGRLRSAFRQIVELGKEPQFRRGYTQFLTFMAAVDACHRRNSKVPEKLAGEFIDDQDSFDALQSSSESKLMAILAELPEFDDLREALNEELWDSSKEKDHVKLLLSRDNASPVAIDLGSGESGKVEIPHLIPGRYGLSLATGMVIWESELTKQDLYWAYALPDEPLRLAADTGDLPERPSRQLEILEGEIVLAVFPGRDCGRMEIQRRP